MSNSNLNRRMVLTFRQGGVLFGVFARYVEEITARPKLSPLPGKSFALKGILAYKGEILPVVSFARLCGADAGEDENTCLILRQDGEGAVGLLIEKAIDLITDDDERLIRESEALNCGNVKIDCVLRRDDAVMVIDIKKTFDDLSVKWGIEL